MTRPKLRSPAEKGWTHLMGHQIVMPLADWRRVWAVVKAADEFLDWYNSPTPSCDDKPIECLTIAVDALRRAQEIP